MAKGSAYKIYRFDSFSLDTVSLMLYRGPEAVSIPPKAVKTLAVLVQSAGEIVSKDELIEQIWDDSIVEESNLSQYLYLLRKTLGKQPDGTPYIETLRRRGYRFNGKTLHFAEPDAEDTEGRSPPGPRYEVKRRGNVLALTDWQPRSASEIVAAEVAPAKRTFAKRGLSKALLLAAALSLAVGIMLTSAFFVFNSHSTEGTAAPAELSITRLTNGIEVKNATISPDGKYFVYSETKGNETNIWLQQTGYTARIEIIPATKRQIWGKTISPDGSFVYFVASEPPYEVGSLFRVPTLGGPETKVLGEINSPVSFSPDGVQITYYRFDASRRSSELVIMPGDGKGQDRVIARWPSDSAFSSSPAWSPDGRMIAYFTPSNGSDNAGLCSLVVHDLAAGKTREFSSEKWATCYRVVWRPDGGGVYFIGTKESEGLTTRRDQVYYVSFPDGRSRRITTDESRHQPLSLGITGDGSLLAVPFNRSSQIWGMDAGGDARTAVQITNGLSDGRAGIAPLADGRVGFITRTGESMNVWVMNQDGTEQKQVTVDPILAEELRSGGRGEHFVFSAQQGQFSQLFRVDADSGDRVQLTYGKSFVVDSSVSADGMRIAYDQVVYKDTAHERTLWRMNIDGSDARQLSVKDCGMPHFSPDDKAISCVQSQDTIHIVSADAGEKQRSLKARPNATLNFGARWHPDGLSLVYIVTENGVSNLWLHEIETGNVRPLTDFKSGSIYNFAFSQDGKRLFVARGHQIRDAILIRHLEQLKADRGVPWAIKVDNGSEFISKVLDHWAYENNVTLDFSRPGKPTDNAFIESFNGTTAAFATNV